MVDIKFNTKKAIKTLEEKPQKVKRSVERESSQIITDVYMRTLDDAPVWNDVLRHTILTESKPFKQITEHKIRLELTYDAFNPRTGFHYAYLRHRETKDPSKSGWFYRSLEENHGYVERIITNAVKRGVGT